MVNLLKVQQVHRLNTHEDQTFFYAHKVLGILVLANFIYRGYLRIRHGSMMLEAADFPYWLVIHAALHLTSFQFHLSTKRNRTYNIIWPEMRWHTMIFAYRSIITLTIQWLANEKIIPMYINDYSRGPIVLLTIIAADLVTNYYKKREMLEGTTMRGNPYPAWIPKCYIPYHNLFYSVSQVLGTMNILTHREMGRIFMILIPIQTAPFCMTLVKKGVIDQFAWHFYYTAALLSNYVYGAVTSYYDPINPFWFYWTAFALFCIGRFGLNMNKYLLWGYIVAASTYMQHV